MCMRAPDEPTRKVAFPTVAVIIIISALNTTYATQQCKKSPGFYWTEVTRSTDQGWLLSVERLENSFFPFHRGSLVGLESGPPFTLSQIESEVRH